MWKWQNHRTQLVDDIDSYVRCNVARYGNRNLRKRLMHDSDADIRNATRCRSRFWVGVWSCQTIHSIG